MRKRKFKPGRPITTMPALVRRLERGDYVLWHGTPKHPGWMRSMQYQTLSNAVRAGILRRAVPVDAGCAA